MGPLNRRLAEIRAEREAKRPPEATALMSRATDELRASGILDGVAAVGQPAPRFARPALSGDTIRLAPLLSHGPVILSFFRGRW